MALNPFFLQGSNNEQFLVQDLINEQLKIYGVDVYYLPSISSGIREGRITEYTFADLITRPKEGDLIYFPLGERLFEIKRVESEKPFYQLGKNYTYELSCELYEYENELIDTNIEEVDNTVEDEGYITTLNLVGTAITATATATISASSITEVFLNNDGAGYTSPPKVIISDPAGGIGTITASAIAITTSIGNVQSIERIEITNSGVGYLTPPTITFSGGGGSGAAATCSIGSTTEFSVNQITVGNQGQGYTDEPIVTISGPVGSGVTAIGIASITSDGKLNSVNLIKPGVGYTVAPTVSIAGFSTVGFGTFVYNETVTGQSSGVTARVRDFRTTTSPFPGTPPATDICRAPAKRISTDLRVSLNTGEFYTGEVIVGSISSARYVVNNYDTESYDNPYDTNEEIETEADDILDFTESNPFGSY